jgi:hypothetical protein
VWVASLIILVLLHVDTYCFLLCYQTSRLDKQVAIDRRHGYASKEGNLEAAQSAVVQDLVEMLTGYSIPGWFRLLAIRASGPMARCIFVE